VSVTNSMTLHNAKKPCNKYIRNRAHISKKEPGGGEEETRKQEIK
jgi:hypothetical protein